MLLASLLPYMGVGLLAQMVDGALGMAYGVTTSTPRSTSQETR